MQRYEYHVVPAPRRGEKARDAKTTADRFAVALTRLMNDLGRDGWEYLRADTLPCEERAGLTGRTTAFQHMLVFRRPLQADRAAEPAAPQQLAAPVLTATAAEGAAPRLVMDPKAAPQVPPLGPARSEETASG
ncbi:MAG: DUF4177 domain-containing protein [Rhodobacter sp.]|nr:DUF4177 domain-containing protein [Rhodobacter sp.]